MSYNAKSSKLNDAIDTYNFYKYLFVIVGLGLSYYIGRN